MTNTFAIATMIEPKNMIRRFALFVARRIELVNERRAVAANLVAESILEGERRRGGAR